jgi:hypothetical protein
VAIVAGLAHDGDDLILAGRRGSAGSVSELVPGAVTSDRRFRLLGRRRADS